ncbi:chalcone isomerase family protein [Pseudoalteromonas aurantia]|uniref:Chalcone isomerase domain-containing protein n=1 Tax=Pseudoalteromonas aurantia 208 TaxID=1314867 RepID=A0ABR9EGW3_9GAMM|nr:chalcone isomerase family protein [Pseudoalteromonas aurantia]MBE0370227.1 hypothetical protein [Pseudoalteromonas aurantia 208]
MKTIAFVIVMLMNIKLVYATPMSLFIENPKAVGSTSRMSYLFWDIYDATLYAQNGHYDAAKPFALKLNYLRDLSGHDIANRSIDEMEKQGFNNHQKLQLWRVTMQNIFPDVKNGTQLLGVRNAAGESLFYNDDQLIGQVSDTEFTTHFFAIWLNERTSEPMMRKELLALEEAP